VAVVFTIQAAGTATLSFTGRDTTAAVIGVIAFGLGFGVATITKPVLLADRYDTRNYATIAGALIVPMTIAKASAPLVAAFLHTGSGSYAVVFLAASGGSVVAAGAMALVGKRHRAESDQRVPWMADDTGR
jgi:hypothetical protein